MEIRKGTGVKAGFAIGPAVVFEREEFRIRKQYVPAHEAAHEVERFNHGRNAAIKALTGRLAAVSKRFGPVALGVIKGHLDLLSDVAMRDEIVGAIKRHNYAAEYAVSKFIRSRLKALEDSGQDTFFQRIQQDFVDIEKALLRALLGEAGDAFLHITSPVVVVAHSLSPAQTASLDKTKTLGILLDVGGRSSHTSIVAASMGIPTVVGLETMTNDVSTGDTIIVDGQSGTVIVKPDEATLKRYQAMARNFEHVERKDQKLRHEPAVTKDGHRIEVLGNIEYPEEIGAALDFGAEGIGLYRTEFMYLGGKGLPNEEDHFQNYRTAIERLGTRKLVIRTVDLGADKMPVDGIASESNPMMGIRAIRLCLERPDVFRPQVRAILRASRVGRVSMMLPLITSLAEIRQTREVIGRIRDELTQQGEPPAPEIPLGIMIETPAAAQIADLLAAHVDFFSIGTNDLIAYTLAVDRGNEQTAKYYQPSHPAILRMVKRVVDVGAMNGKPVALCGEMASDLRYTLPLLGMGLKTFSVGPPVAPVVKNLIRLVTLESARAIAEKVLSHEDAEETDRFLLEEAEKIIPDLL